jgi:hypothetical protein
MEEFFFSNRSEQILYDLLTNYIGKQSGHNITKYPQVRSILKNSIRNVYSIKNTYPEMRNTKLTDKERISFLQKKVLRRCLPTIIGHIKQVDSRRTDNLMVPQNRNNPLGKQISNRRFDDNIMPLSMKQAPMLMQHPQIDDPTTFNRPVTQRSHMTHPHTMTNPSTITNPRTMTQPPRNKAIEGVKISMETRAQLDELIQQHEPQSHNLDSGTQQSFSTLEDTQQVITNQPVEQDEPIKDLARRSDDLLREREDELKAMLQKQEVPVDKSVEDTDRNNVENTVINNVGDTVINNVEDTVINNVEDNGNRLNEFKKEMEATFERDMRLKLNELNNAMTDMRSHNVKLERERDTLQNTINKIMTDTTKNNDVTTSFKNELDEYKTKYNTLLESTTDKFKKLEEQYETSKTDLIQKIQTEMQTKIQTDMQTGFNLKYKEYETELKLLQEHIKKQHEIVLSQHKMIQTGLNNSENGADSNGNINSFKIFSVNRMNRIRPITWEEKKDSVGVILKNNCVIKNSIMKVDNYSVVLPSNGFPSSDVYNMKLMKVLIHRCNIIGDVPDFIECHIRLNKRGGEGDSSLVNYTYNLKLDSNSFNGNTSNYIGYIYHNEEKQENSLYTMKDLSINGNIIINVNLRSVMHPHNFIRDLNRCYEISGMSLTSTSGNNVLYSLKLNVNDINDISKLKGLKHIAIEHIYFSKYVSTDLKLYTNEQITTFEKWLMSEDMDIYNITHTLNCGKYEISIQIMVSLDQFNFLKKPPQNTQQKWVLRNKMDDMSVGYYGVGYFPELENKLYMEVEY